MIVLIPYINLSNISWIIKYLFEEYGAFNIEHGKCFKISNSLFHTFLAKNFGQKFAFMQSFLKILSGMANSVDPDQTAPEEQSDLGLHYLHMPFSQKPWCIKF